MQMNAQQEILARIKRIEKHLGIPADLPQSCDLCSNPPTFTQTIGWPKTTTVRRCDEHPTHMTGTTATAPQQ